MIRRRQNLRSSRQQLSLTNLLVRSHRQAVQFPRPERRRQLTRLCHPPRQRLLQPPPHWSRPKPPLPSEWQLRRLHAPQI